MVVTRVAMSDRERPRRFRWTRDAYHRLAEMGFIGPEEKTELIGGLIMVKESEGRTHSLSLMRSRRAIEAAFGNGYHVQDQMPIALAEDGEPEPDICVLRRVPEDYPEIPAERDVLLVVEVSDATLSFDRNRKASLYAQAGIADYWIINLVDRQVEVYRNPVADSDTPYGYVYASVTEFQRGESVSPLAMPVAPIPVTELLLPVDVE